jgi:predicted transposase YbfD/YdcC
VGRRDRAHGRLETRTLKVVSVGGFGFPHVAQVIQVTRTTRDLHRARRRRRTVVVYAVTSLPHAQASPGRLADLLRGHWAIENGLHYVRAVTFGEDGCRVRTGAGAQVMACLRNLVIGVLGRAGPVNLAAALRHHSRDPHRPWPPWESPSDESNTIQGRRSPGSGLTTTTVQTWCQECHIPRPNPTGPTRLSAPWRDPHPMIVSASPS